MSQRYPTGPAQSSYNYFTQRSSVHHISGPSPIGLTQHTLPPPHSSSPLTNTTHALANEPHAYHSRHPSLLMTSQAETVGQSGTFPVYAPTGNVYYNQSYGSENSPLQHLLPPMEPPQSYRPPPMLHMSSQPHTQPAHLATSRSLPEIAPMPPRSLGDPIPAFGNDSISHLLEERCNPQHVVGAQGRRGILPSIQGRPPAVVGANPNGQKIIPTPAKDDDGKYPCPHCEKHYLHAKHLKRHLLRHTGVRPYACGLCNDTFSRSDILKRHFQKCSSRRGNPTGQSHLSLSRANKKAKEQQDAGLTGNGTPTVADHAHMANYPPTTMDASFDINTLTLNQHNYGGPSNQVSRSNSVTQPKRGTESQSNRASLGMMTTSSYESGNYATSTGHVTPDSITTSGAATPYTFHHELRPTQLPESGSFPQSSHADLSFPASSRPPTSSHYATTPHIVTQEYGREYSSDWQNYPPHNTHDEYGNEQHHSGTHTPLERDKPATDYTGVTLPNYQYLAHQRP